MANPPMSLLNSMYARPVDALLDGTAIIGMTRLIKTVSVMPFGGSPCARFRPARLSIFGTAIFLRNLHGFPSHEFDSLQIAPPSAETCTNFIFLPSIRELITHS